jgi:hypothetical protein
VRKITFTGSKGLSDIDILRTVDSIELGLPDNYLEVCPGVSDVSHIPLHHAALSNVISGIFPLLLCCFLPYIDRIYLQGGSY